MMGIEAGWGGGGGGEEKGWFAPDVTNGGFKIIKRRCGMIRRPAPCKRHGQLCACTQRNQYEEGASAGRVAAAACTTAVELLAAVRHAVAARAGGVVAPAHTARVNGLAAIRNTITTQTGSTVTITHSTRISNLAAVRQTIAANARANIKHIRCGQGLPPQQLSSEANRKSVKSS
jgi:hypothetical protein